MSVVLKALSLNNKILFVCMKILVQNFNLKTEPNFVEK